MRHGAQRAARRRGGARHGMAPAPSRPPPGLAAPRLILAAARPPTQPLPPRPSTQVIFTINGETGKSVSQFSKNWLGLVPTVSPGCIWRRRTMPGSKCGARRGRRAASGRGAAAAQSRPPSPSRPRHPPRPPPSPSPPAPPAPPPGALVADGRRQDVPRQGAHRGVPQLQQAVGSSPGLARARAPAVLPPPPAGARPRCPPAPAAAAPPPPPGPDGASSRLRPLHPPPHPHPPPPPLAATAGSTLTPSALTPSPRTLTRRGGPPRPRPQGSGAACARAGTPSACHPLPPTPSAAPTLIQTPFNTPVQKSNSKPPGVEEPGGQVPDGPRQHEVALRRGRRDRRQRCAV
jgi:hypothetical protein